MSRAVAGAVVSFFLAMSTAWGQSDRAKEAADLILKLCIADSTQIEISRDKNSVQVSGDNDSVTIKRSEITGIAGGISSSLNQLSAQQASEARACTQRYLKKIVDALLSDDNAIAPAAKTEYGDIHITRYPMAFQCTINYAIFMNGISIAPYTDDWLVQGIKLGRTKWVIKGSVNCNNGYAYCASNMDNQTGDIDLQKDGRYIFTWQVVPGSARGSECQFSLFKQS